MATKIAIANVKGGIGKTSTTIALADGLRAKKKKVLTIDCDANSMSTTGVYGAKTEDTYTLADIFFSDEDVSMKDCVQKTEYGDVIACESVVKDADTKIPADADRFYYLIDAGKSIEKEYDFVLIDCPPGDGAVLGNVLSYVDYVIIPITCDLFGIQCLNTFKSTLESYKKRINPSLKVLGVLMTMYEGRQSLTKDLEDGIIPKEAENIGAEVFSTRIRRSVKLKESQIYRVPIYEYAKNSTVSKDYLDFTNEVLKKARK